MATLFITVHGDVFGWILHGGVNTMYVCRERERVRERQTYRLRVVHVKQCRKDGSKDVYHLMHCCQHHCGYMYS